MHVNDNTVRYLDSFGFAHTQKKLKKFIGKKNITTNIYEIQAYDSVICEYFCRRFIDFMLKIKTWESLLIYFHQTILKMMINILKNNIRKFETTQNMYLKILKSRMKIKENRIVVVWLLW